MEEHVDGRRGEDVEDDLDARDGLADRVASLEVVADDVVDLSRAGSGHQVEAVVREVGAFVVRLFDHLVGPGLEPRGHGDHAFWVSVGYGRWHR